MKRLSKEDRDARKELVSQLTDSREKVEGLYAEIESARSRLVEALEEFNGLVEEAENLRDEVVGKMEEYESDRSEKWADGDAGQAFGEWKSEWEGADFSPVDIPEELEAPDLEEIVGNFENLPEEVGL